MKYFMEGIQSIHFYFYDDILPCMSPLVGAMPLKIPFLTSLTLLIINILNV